MEQTIDTAIIVGVVALCALWYAVGRRDGYKRGVAATIEEFETQFKPPLVDLEVIKDINRQERLEDLEDESALEQARA